MDPYYFLEGMKISYGMRENSIDVPHRIKTEATYDLVQNLEYA